MRAQARTAVISELSESLAFATWVRFWRNLVFLIDRKLVEGKGTRDLFCEWFMWRAPFMVKFTEVCHFVMEEIRNKYSYEPKRQHREQTSVFKLRELHIEHFDVPAYCGYATAAAIEKRVRAVATPILERVIEAIESDPNFQVGSALHRCEEAN